METPPGKELFLRLVEDNKGILFKVCHSYCRDKSDREDLAQEIIYQLWKSMPRFSDQYKFSTWMYRVALNTAISFYRKEKRGAPVVPFTGIDMDIEDTRGDGSEADGRLRLLQQFISRLKDLDRALILLYLEEKPYAEIAEIVGISETNVATRLSRIKDKLKSEFANISK
jgi:RNA polymerase sigma-70 factor (ECF subfamily)